MHTLWTIFALLTVAEAQPVSVNFMPVAENAKIQSSAITEASGLAESPTNPGFLWVVNDSGGTPDIHLVDTDGTERGTLTLKDTKNTDWEDLASFTLDGKPYLLVADTGDNKSKRESCTLSIVREPTLPSEDKKLCETVLPTWQIQFRYPEGPRDCEAVAVDSAAGKIILISKRTHPPEVYELPLRPPPKKGIQTALRIGLTSVESPAARLIPFANQPTGFDITADGTLAAVITYSGTFLFPRAPGEGWAEAFARKPAALEPHHCATTIIMPP